MEIMKYVKSALLICLGCFVFVSACKKEKETVESTVPVIYYKVKSTWPHDTEAFTQGLVVHNGLLYESTGQEGKSWIGIVDVKTGEADKKIILDDKYFGEGITILNNKIYQLTYKERTVIVYDQKTMKQLQTFPLFTNEGWGMTNDGKHIIFSDGSVNIYFVYPNTFKEVKRISVSDNYVPVSNINELDLINGFIYSNQWQTDYILKIDTASGKVVAQANLTNLRAQAGIPPVNQRTDEGDPEYLNGIAYDKAGNRIFITGKYWPKLFEVKLDN